MNSDMQRFLDQKRESLNKTNLLASDLYCDLTAKNICEGLFILSENPITDYHSDTGKLCTFYNLAGKISDIVYDAVSDRYSYNLTLLDSTVLKFNHASKIIFSEYHIDVLETRKSLIDDFLR